MGSPQRDRAGAEYKRAKQLREPAPRYDPVNRLRIAQPVTRIGIEQTPERAFVLQAAQLGSQQALEKFARGGGVTRLE